MKGDRRRSKRRRPPRRVLASLGGGFNGWTGKIGAAYEVSEIERWLIRTRQQ